MASTVTALGHGNNPFYGPNQMLISDALGQRAVIDLNSAAVNSVVARTATGLGVVPSSAFGLSFPLLAPLSSASAPSYSFTGDTNTGIFSSGPDSLSFAVGGTNAVVIDATGMTAEVRRFDGPTYTLFATPGEQTGIGQVDAGQLDIWAAGVVVGTLSSSFVSLGSGGLVSSSGTKIGQSSAAGTGCVIIGNSSGSLNLGSNVVGIGTDVLDGTPSGFPTGIVAIGAGAMRGNLQTPATNSVAVGSGSLAAMNTTGALNTAMGHNAGLSLTTATGCTLVGNVAGSALTTSSNCTIVGSAAKCGDTISAGSTIVGQNAGTTTLGVNNTIMGVNAMNAATTAVAGCVAVGSAALAGPLNGTAQRAVAVGTNALTAMTAATDCTAVGHSSGLALTSGSSNTFVGASAGTTLQTGTNNTIVGAAANVSTSGRSGTVVLGQGSSGTVDNGLFIRSTTATVAAGNTMNFAAGGQIGPTTSSIRFKTDVALAPVDPDTPGELKPIDRIRVVDFEAKTNATGERLLGVIAEELAPLVHPSLIPKDEEGDPFGVSYDRLTCLLIQELQLVRRRLAALEGTPLPDLDPYVPVKEADLYDDTKVDNELMARQKQQGREALRRLRVVTIADRITRRPERESAILTALNKSTRDAVRAELEARALKEAADAQRLAEEETTAREARLDALARKHIAVGDVDSTGPKMKARIAALLAADKAREELLKTQEEQAKAQAAVVEERAKLEEKALEENWEKE